MNVMEKLVAQRLPEGGGGRESVGELMRRLIDEVMILVRSEVRLAGSEMRAKATGALGSVGAIAAGGLLATLATGCLLVAAVAALAEVVGLVWAALIIGAVLLAVGGMLVLTGLAKLKKTQLAPERTIANLKRDALTLKGD